MIRRPPRSTHCISSAASDVYKRQQQNQVDQNAKQQLQNTKIDVLQLPALSQNPKLANKDELLAARLFNELNVLFSIETNDIVEFENSMSRLRVFYENYKNILPESKDQNKFVSLNLLYLLSYNKISEFHTAVELIPFNELSNQYIQFVLELEQSINVGNFQEALKVKSNAPLKQFNMFLDRIFETIRYEKARSAEKAYKKLDIQEALKIFNLNNLQELNDYIVQNNKLSGETGFKWQIENQELQFQSIAPKQKRFNAEQLIKTTLNYAHELEKII
eukprot:TRINITY_DN8812_c0_g1_i4.p1 TRINITY_DN8812_c0_g1~~TRINITY_DN8812_c0_g1_i4.p1  ORF type:complete len:276 (+),score=71.16 TRINITY_DN8812_c0_g1_i4:131-958(+)